MLRDSDEKDNIQHYMTKPIVSETMNHLLRELAWDGGAYKRDTPKVSRNDPCPVVVERNIKDVVDKFVGYSSKILI